MRATASRRAASPGGIPWTPELVVGLRSALEVALSPDGTHAVLVTGGQAGDGPQARYGIAARVVALADGGEPATIAPLAGHDAHAPAWSPDGSRLAWLARSSPAGTDRLHAGGRHGDGAAVIGPDVTVLAFEWSPNGGQIAVLAMDSAIGQVRLCVLHLADGTLDTVSPPGISVHEVAWSPDGTRVAVIAAPGPTVDDRVARARPAILGLDGDLRDLAREPRRLRSIAWSPDGRWIAWVGGISVTDTPGGSVIAVRSTGGEPIDLTPGYEGTATALRWLPGEPATIVFAAVERLAHVVRTITAPDAAMTPLLVRPGLAFGLPSFAADGGSAAVIASSPDHPPELFTWVGREADALVRRTALNPELAGVVFGQQAPTCWPTSDGLEIDGILTLPPDFAAGLRYPTVLVVHGGPERVNGIEWQLDAQWDSGLLLAERGYVVLAPNYRGGIGRGVEFSGMSRGDIGGGELDDIMAGLDHLVTLGLADPERVGIMGGSHGGHLAALAATRASGRFAAAVVICGITDWLSMAETGDDGWHAQVCHFGVPIADDPVRYRRASAVSYVASAATPTLILHGALDTGVPPSQADALHVALRARGVETDLVIYPRERHEVQERAHQLDILHRVTAWFDRHLGNPIAGQPRAASTRGEPHE